MQFEEIASTVPEISLEYDQILKGGGRFGQRWYLPEDLVLAARREEIDWVHAEGVYEIIPTQECKDADMKPLDLIWVDTDSPWIQHARKFDRGCVQENTKRRSKVRFNEVYPLLNCSLQCHLSKQ